MKKLLPLALLLFSFTLSGAAEEVLRGQAADKAIPGTELIRYKNFSSVPAFVKFNPAKRIAYSQWQSWVQSTFFKDQNNIGFDLISEEEDRLGMHHYRYQQTVDGYPLTFGIWIIHVLDGQVVSMNGELFDDPGTFQPSLAVASALSNALDHVGATSYKWEIESEEQWLKYEQNDPEATYYPEGNLEVINSDASLGRVDLHLAWKFNIYAHEPMMRKEVFVDAVNGNVIFDQDLIHEVDSTCNANTAYSGVRQIIADYTGSQFRLREFTRGNGVSTYDMNNGTGAGNGSDIYNATNYWNPFGIGQYALDAHFGAEMTYDFYWENFNRNSINNNGFELISRVHYGNNFANAFWDGQRMTYGDGNFTYDPLTTLDIAGHEITHGLTNFTANLVYEAESGALNESFSDIFGAAIEFHTLGFSNGDWLMGEDIGGAFRSLSNPNAYGDPDTYLGNNWVSVNPPCGQGNDNCGVHTNSGVQNFWFYLLTEGGSGTNDINNTYNVTGINIDDAAAIAYRNLTVYLTVTSQYSDARFYAIESAIDLFGPCTQQVESTADAWYAVGVGSAFSATVTADFSSNSTGNCYVPYQIEFYNYSSNATNYSWDFGDGNSSTVPSPIHTYTTAGTYTVELQVSSSCGTDTKTLVDYITVGPDAPCEVVLPETGVSPVQYGCTGTIYDDGGPNENYSNNANSYVIINPTGAGSVTLNFTNFNVEAGSGSSCNYDYVQVYDGIGLSAPLLGTYCNNNQPPASVTSNGSAVTVRFYTDQGLTMSGFQIDWECNDPTEAPAPDFEAEPTTTCDGSVVFTDLSMNGSQQWFWRFGDGATDTVQNPVHTYGSNGTYTVTLIASNNIGSDSITKTSYITVDRPEAPDTMSVQICPEEQATFTYSSTENYRWYDDSISTTPIHEGFEFTTPILESSTPYYVELIEEGPQEGVGPTSSTFGLGGYLNFEQSLYFDAFSPFILKSVKVYAASSGTRHVVLLDNNGNTVDEADIQISFGQQTLDLNFDVPVGVDYQLAATNQGDIDLYRNSTDADYPYELPGVLSITRSSATTEPYEYYYYFYDWKVAQYCTSERTAIAASTGVCTGVEEVGSYAFTVFPNPARDAITISGTVVSSKLSVELYDLAGQLVMSKKLNDTQNMSLDVSGLSKGVYNLQIKNPQSAVESHRIVLQ